LGQNEYVVVRQRSLAYIDEELFFECISNVFILSMDAVQSSPGLETETAFFLKDSALPHILVAFYKRWATKNIIPNTFPAHTTNLFQALDRVFFGALKKLKAIAVGELNDDSVNPIRPSSSKLLTKQEHPT
jgi:hypothetical protein